MEKKLLFLYLLTFCNLKVEEIKVLDTVGGGEEVMSSG